MRPVPYGKKQAVAGGVVVGKKWQRKEALSFKTVPWKKCAYIYINILFSFTSKGAQEDDKERRFNCFQKYPKILYTFLSHSNPTPQNKKQDLFGLQDRYLSNLTPKESTSFRHQRKTPTQKPPAFFPYTSPPTDLFFFNQWCLYTLNSQLMTSNIPRSLATKKKRL